MHLNGWQRLFVVMTAFWSVLVIAVATLDWPSESGLSRADVLQHIDPAVGERIVGYFAAVGKPDPDAGFRTQILYHVGSKSEDLRRLRGSNGTFYFFPVTTPEAEIVAALTKEGLKQDSAQPLFVDAPLPVPINVAGHDLEVTPVGIDKDDSIAEAANAFGQAIGKALLARRLSHAAWAAAAAIIPMLILYALGYSIAWVRRGFAAQRQ